MGRPIMHALRISLMSALLVCFALPAAAQEMTPRQKTEFAETSEKNLSNSVQRLLKQIEEANKAKDVLRLNCLNEKLGQLRGILKVVQDARVGLQEAVARENADLAEHNFRKVVISSEQGEVISAEADACAGTSGAGGGEGTRIVVTVEGEGGGDNAFGSSPSGTTRTPEASPRE